MSFFKKIAQEFEGLGLGGDKKDASPPAPADGQRGYHQDSAPPAQYYAAPPPSGYPAPSDKPPLPEGWTAQFDQQHQRWFYVEIATGRSQWEAPRQYSAPSVPPPDGSRGYGGGYGGAPGYGAPPSGYGSPAPGYGAPPSGYGSPAPGYGAPPSGYGSAAPGYGAPPSGYGSAAPGYGAPPSGYGSPAPGYGGAPGYGANPPSGYGGGPGNGHDDDGGEHKEKSDKKGMLLGAAGGLAVGAIGGALIANALDDSDDEHHAAPAPVPAADPGYGHNPPPAEYGDPYAQDGPPAVLPPTDEDGHSVSSSDREDVQEAREEYEEALADSDASHSDVEEAREEYEETYEEVYED